MQTNVLEYLEKVVQTFPDKIAFADEETSLTFWQFSVNSRRIGSYFASIGVYKQPVLVYMKRSPAAISAFFGVVYSGSYYLPVDDEMPIKRIELIIENVQPEVIIYDETTREMAGKIAFSGKSFSYEELIKTKEDKEALVSVREKMLDTDLLYVLFTSGSTGIPKGVAGHHRGVIDYIENLSEVLNFSENTVFGNQTPLYMDACMKDIYPTLKYGATTYLIPKQYFMFPIRLVQYLNEKKINTICWVVSALVIISAFDTFSAIKPEYLHTIAFSGEVFPIKQFNLWKAALPEAKFFNLYGPTEATGVSCYYPVTRFFKEKEMIPIGRPFRNTEILLLTEENKQVLHGETGEICIRGTCLTYGYYNNLEKTEEVFVQNPLNLQYPEKIYRTGDLGKFNEDGDLLFLSRRDHQIKHMGHRIELGEIEANVTSDGVKTCCCIYIKEIEKIVLFYSGIIEKKELVMELKKKLPHYMLPNAIIKLEQLPLTINGKMDRQAMEVLYRNKKIQSNKKRKENHHG